jgi:hypothetical protein
VDKQSLAEIMERDIARLKAARPSLASRIERAEHILVTQLSVTNGSRPVKVRVHADGSRSYRVASGSKLTRIYRVDPAAAWSCSCPDHGRRRAACKHALACWVLERAYRPSPAGFEEAPHACYDGLVYIGHLVEDECGEEAEIVEAVPCRRCAEVL